MRTLHDSPRPGARRPSWIILLTGAMLGGCTDDRDPLLPDPTALEVILSEPVSTPGAPLGTAASGEEGVVYVSLPPQSARGSQVTIRNLASGYSRTDPLIDGGLDPVRVPATVGDRLELEALAGSVVTGQAVITVSARRPPRVVRTHPPKGKRDVPLNAVILVVFSEPINAQTINGSVYLSGAGQPIDADLDLDANGLYLHLSTESPLAPGTEYTLSIRDDIADQQGERLEAVVEVTFTTVEPAILIDASRDGGVWWYPQAGVFDPTADHQGKPLADYLRAAGYRVVELPRPYSITADLLRDYELVIRAGVCCWHHGSAVYDASEIGAYQDYVAAGGRLLLAADHLAFAPADGTGDPLALAFGLQFAGITRGDNLLDSLVPHPITAGVTSLGYGIGSALLSVPESAQVLGTLTAGSYLDLNNNEMQEPDEISAPAVMGVMPYGDGRIVFSGDVNFWNWVPQPLLDNVLTWLRENRSPG